MTVLPVFIDSWVIGDHGDPPRVGRTEQYNLRFVDTPEPDTPPTPDSRPSAGVWDLEAEPRFGGDLQVVRRVDGSVGGEFYEVLLHGSGWSAAWRSPRPVPAGPVRLHGYLVWDWPGHDAATAVRGRVRRVQVVAGLVDTSGGEPGAATLLPGRWSLRDVAESPTQFDNGRPDPTTPPGGAGAQPVYLDPWWVESGALVDLDVDHAAAIMAGAISAHGPELWVADRTRPLVVCVHDPLGPCPTVRRYDWPPPPRGTEQGAGERWLHADAAGCWLADAHGLRRLEGDGGSRLVDPAPVRRIGRGRPGGHVTAAAGPTLAVLRSDPAPHTDSHDTDSHGSHDHDPQARLTRYCPTGLLGETAVPARSGTVLVGAGGFLVLLNAPRPPEATGPTLIEVGRESGLPHPHRRLVRVDNDGRLHPDPVLPAHVLRARPVPRDALGQGAAATGLDGPLLRISPHDRATELPPMPRGNGVLHSWCISGRVFVAGQAPDPDELTHDDHDRWWPLPGPPAIAAQRQPYWISELDPDTLDPLRAHPVPRLSPGLTIDGHGTVWVRPRTQQNAEVLYLPDDTDSPARTLDINTLL